MAILSSHDCTYSDLVTQFTNQLTGFINTKCRNITPDGNPPSEINNDERIMVGNALAINFRALNGWNQIIPGVNTYQPNDAYTGNKVIQINRTVSEYPEISSNYKISDIVEDIRDFMEKKITNSSGETYSTLANRIITTAETLKVYNVMLQYIQSKIIRVYIYGYFPLTWKDGSYNNLDINNEIFNNASNQVPNVFNSDGAEALGENSTIHDITDRYFSIPKKDFRETKLLYVFYKVDNDSIDTSKNIIFNRNIFISPSYFIENINRFTKFVIARQTVSL